MPDGDLLSATFYGVRLDENDPYLRRNLNRLEARFRSRYYSSVQKDLKRRQKGKASHKTTLHSIAENYARLQEIRRIRAALFRNREGKANRGFVQDSVESKKGETPRSEMLKTVKVSL